VAHPVVDHQLRRRQITTAHIDPAVLGVGDSRQRRGGDRISLLVGLGGGQDHPLVLGAIELPIAEPQQ
jgi:hypothetical protein